MITELRLLFAELLLRAAVHVAPPNADGKRLAKFVLRYVVEAGLKDGPSE